MQDSLQVRLDRPPPLLPAHRRRRLIRHGSALTLAATGSLLGVDAATVSRWEAGVHEPRGAARLLYAALLEELERDCSLVAQADSTTAARSDLEHHVWATSAYEKGDETPP